MPSHNPLTIKGKTDLGVAWAGNSANCVPFRSDAMRTRGDYRYVSYFDGNGDVVIASIDTIKGSVDRSIIRNERKPFDAHQAISMAVDSKGVVHLAFGAHGSSLLVTKSRGSSSNMEFDNVTEHKAVATYPMFVHLPNDELVLLSRRGSYFEGAIFADRLGPGGQWLSDSEPLLTGYGGPWTCGPYLNTPVIGQNGEVYLFVVWRLDPKATCAGAVVNVGIDGLVSRDSLRSVETFDGVQLASPVTPVTSERIIAVPMGASLINQAAATLLTNGLPAAVTYWADGDGIPQFRMCWQREGKWTVAKISDFKSNFKLDGSGTLPLPHSRPEIISRADGRVLIIFRTSETGNTLNVLELSPPSYDLSGGRQQVLVFQDLGHYEPILDRSAWRERSEVVIYVQACEQQPDSDGKFVRATSDAYILSCEWS